MDQWYYAKAGQQTGPIRLETMRSLIQDGTIDPATDLVWNSDMKDWAPASQVSVLSGVAPRADTPPTYPATQPFGYPTASGSFEEIEPGSVPIIATACVKRGWDLTVKNLGAMLIVSLLYFFLSWLLGEGFDRADAALGLNPGRNLPLALPPGATEWESFKHGYLHGSLSIPMTLLSNLAAVYLMLGFTKIGLNVVSGKPFRVGMLFGGGKWLLHGFLGYMFYLLIISIGFVLLIFPGIYLMFRFGMYQMAIVDKDLNVVEAFKYSSRITKGNKMSLFVIFLFSFGIMLAGCIALIVGILFAYPVVWLSWATAYRWMQYGERAVMDDPATGKPLLAGAQE